MYIPTSRSIDISRQLRSFLIRVVNDIYFILAQYDILTGGSPATFFKTQHRFSGLDLYYADPAQHLVRAV